MRSVYSLLAGASAVHAYTVINHKPFMQKNIDPLVGPGTYTSHMHTFFGSDAITNVMPSTAELQTGCYTGDNANDLSVYWIPTLYYVNDTGRVEVPIFRFSTYYENAGYAQEPFPANMGLIAGNTKAKSQADVDETNTTMSWWCEEDEAEAKDGGKFPTKTCSTHLQTILRFPDCINKADMTKYDYSSGAWGTDTDCPEGMVRIPRLRFSVRYDLRKIIPGGWEGTAPLQLACGEVGDGYCFHGDWINGWYDDAAKNLLEKADADGKQKFVQIDGEHGTGSVDSTCTAEDADPTNGTSDYETSLEMMAAGGSTSNSTQPVKEEATETCPSAKRSVGSKSKRAAARRALQEALAALDALEE